jgi:hypothetical protein
VKNSRLGRALVWAGVGAVLAVCAVACESDDPAPSGQPRNRAGSAGSVAEGGLGGEAGAPAAGSQAGGQAGADAGTGGAGEGSGGFAGEPANPRCEGPDDANVGDACGVDCDCASISTLFGRCSPAVASDSSL